MHSLTYKTFRGLQGLNDMQGEGVTLPRANRLRLISDGPPKVVPKAEPKYQPMSKRELEEWADSLPANFLACRAKKHNMKLKDTWPTGRGFTMVYRCVSCRTLLTEIINAAGFVTDRKLEYPKGYLAPKGAGRSSVERNGMMRIRRARRWYNAGGDK